MYVGRRTVVRHNICIVCIHFLKTKYHNQYYCVRRNVFFFFWGGGLTQRMHNNDGVIIYANPLTYGYNAVQQT